MQLIYQNAGSTLLERLQQIKTSSRDYFAIHFHLSLLNPVYKSSYQIKIAVNIINDIFKNKQESIFIIPNGDIFVLYHNDDKGLIEKAIFQLRYLFMDDPLAYNTDGFENDAFCNVYDLELQWEQFFAVCKVKDGHNEASNTSSETCNNVEEDIVDGHSDVQLFTPDTLSSILSQLKQLDIKDVLRYQPVCAAAHDKEIVPLFHETYVSIACLKEMLDIQVDLFSSHSLFRYFTRCLDKILLSFFAEHPGYFTAPASINLNIKTLLSQAFARFDATINDSLKPHIVIEIDVSDVFAHPYEFQLAKEATGRLGYRLCLDGLDKLGFTQVSRSKLGFDLAKVKWSTEMQESSGDASVNKRLEDAVSDYGPNRIILCRCDNKAAMNYGNKLGISLFQGRYFDHILTPDLAVVN